MGRAPQQLPSALRRGASSLFVGRREELEQLRGLLSASEDDGGRVVLLAGDPGAGKSRLVRELAAPAAEDGALVLAGACDAMVPAPFGPFVEALGGLGEALEPDELRAALGAGGAELTRLLPELPRWTGELAEPAPADPDTERHRLHTAVAALLARSSRDRPVLLVLEDVHWADESTLLLLRHVARGVRDTRVLLLATFRDADAEVSDELAQTLADLRRAEDDVVRMRLGGLSVPDVADLVRLAAGCEPGPAVEEVARSLHEPTDGNAFLVRELWRALEETATVEVVAGELRVTRPLADLGTPESVREVVGQRLSRLDPDTTSLLELAATAGSELDLALLRSAGELSEPRLLTAIDGAVRSGMIEELSSRRLAWRFTHEIVRRALYDGLSQARRAELHLAVGEALEASGATSARTLADLAHHFGAAAPLGGSERAVAHNLRAARAARDALAYEEAATRLRTAIDIGVEDESERAEVLLELGATSHRAGHAAAALEAYSSAAELARRLSSGELLARAAIGYEDACWRPGIVSSEAIDLLEEALEALGEGSDELRVGLLAGLARALDFQGERERGAVVRGNAVALARRLDDREGLVKVLVRAYWSRGTSPLAEILAMLTEARDLAEELGDTELRTEAMAWRVPTFVALGDMESARAEVAAQREMAERSAQPFMNHVAEHYGSAIALCDGRLDDAEAMAARSHEWSRLLTGRDASSIYGVQMFGIRREQGRLAELAPAVGILARDTERRGGPWRPGLVAVLTELGMGEEARRELSRIASEGLDQFRAGLWTAALSYLADAASALGDERMAAMVYPELEPLAGSNVMVGHLVACYGAADRYLGMLAATLGEAERAEGHFERALALNREMGASTWVAHTAYEYARLLLARGAGARERADALVAEADELAERIGMEGLSRRLAALGAAAPAGELPDGLSPREAQILELVAGGASNREIGEELSISQHTAANHIRSILRKTGCANRTEAASYAHRHGLVSG